MKLVLLFFAIYSISYSQNFIFQNSLNNNEYLFLTKEYFYSFHESNIIISHKGGMDTLSFLHNKIPQTREFNTTPFQFNYFKANISISGMNAYFEANYGTLNIRADGDKLFIDNPNNFEYLLNNNLVNSSKINQLFPNIKINELIPLSLSIEEDRIEDAEIRNDFSSYIGSYGVGSTNDLKTNKNGDIFISGNTFSQLLSWYIDNKNPLYNDVLKKYDHYYFYNDNYYIKLDKNNKIKWVTVLGSNFDDIETYMDVNDEFMTFVVRTNGPDYQITNPIDINDSINVNSKKKSFKSFNLVIGKLDINTGELLNSSFLGNTGQESPSNVTIDKNGNSWVFLNSTSRNLKTTNNAIQSTSIKQANSFNTDGFIVCKDKNNEIIFASYFASDSLDNIITSIAVDDNIFFGGQSLGSKYPNGNTLTNDNSFLASININTFKLNWIKKYPFVTNNDIALTNDNKLLLLSYVESDGLAKGEVYSKIKQNESDLLLSHLDFSGNITKSTYIGADLYNKITKLYIKSTQLESNITSAKMNRVCVDEYNNAIVVFPTEYGEYSTPDNAIQTKLFEHRFNYLNNNFIMVLDSNLQRLRHSTYWVYGNPRGMVYNNKSIYLTFETIIIDGISTFNGFQRLASGNPEDFSGYISRLKLYPPDVKDTCFSNDFDLNSFRNLKDFKLIQDAKGNADSLTLTINDRFKKGAIFYNKPVNIENGFVTEFTFGTSLGEHLGYKDGSIFGADGFSFILTDNIPDNLGFSGGGLAYEGLKNVLALEIDLHRNITDDYNDPNGNHVAVFSSKDLIYPNHKSKDLVAENTKLPIIRQNEIYTLKVVYSYKLEYLKVYFKYGNREYEELINIKKFKPLEHINLIDGKRIFVGLAASTGNAIQKHSIYNWSFCSADESVSDITSVSNQDNFLISPNPSNNYFEIKTNQVIDNIKIINELGIEVNSFTLNGLLVDVSNLGTGVYFIIINNKEFHKVIKL